MLSEVGLGIGRLGPGQRRAITFLWAATQVAARVVREAFVHIYSSLPDSENGHTPLKDYCNLAGRVSVYFELLDEGYMSDVLSSSPKETIFLDLKVTRKILDKVLAERFGKDKYGKLTFEVRQLVYLRNDLCHQLLPALTFEQYLSRMKQLETRLCVVISEAALIAGKTHASDKILQDIHALFASLLHRHKNPRAENGTQTDLHPPDTSEKGTQARMDFEQRDISEGVCGEAKQNTTSDSRYSGTFGDAGQNTEHIITSPKNSADPGRFSVLSHFRGLAGGRGKTRGFEETGKGERLGKQQGKQDGQKQRRQEECCDARPFSSQSSIKSSHQHLDGRDWEGGRNSFSTHGTLPVTKIFPHSGDHYPPHSQIESPHPHTDGINWKGDRRLHTPYGTQSVTETGPHGAPGHRLCHGELVTLKKLTYEAVTINHVFVKVQDDGRLPLDIIFSLVLKVMLFLAVLIVSLLPLAITLLRVTLEGVRYAWNNADRANSHLWDLCYGPRWQETVCMSEVVLIPHMDPLEVRGPAIAPRQLRGAGMNYIRADRKAGCRRKCRRN